MSINQEFRIDRGIKSEARDVASVHISSWQETYEGIMDSAYLASLSISKRTANWEQYIESPNYNQDQILLILKLVKSKKIIGFCAVSPARLFRDQFDYEIQAIYVLKKFQNKGLGKTLFLEAANFVRSLNKNSFYLGVLEENKTIKFYEHMDGQLHSQFEMVSIGNHTHKEIFYSWRVDELQK